MLKVLIKSAYSGLDVQAGCQLTFSNRASVVILLCGRIKVRIILKRFQKPGNIGVSRPSIEIPNQPGHVETNPSDLKGNRRIHQSENS